MIAQGQRFRTTRDLPVVVMTAWASPSTGGRDGTLPAGTTFAVASDPGASATAVYCEVDDPRIGRTLVPWYDRARFWSYRGFYLCIELRDIREHCEAIDAREDVGAGGGGA